MWILALYALYWLKSPVSGFIGFTRGKTVAKPLSFSKNACLVATVQSVAPAPHFLDLILQAGAFHDTLAIFLRLNTPVWQILFPGNIAAYIVCVNHLSQSNRKIAVN
jgi:hypothetical protein